MLLKAEAALESGLSQICIVRYIFNFHAIIWELWAKLTLRHSVYPLEWSTLIYSIAASKGKVQHCSYCIGANPCPHVASKSLNDFASHWPPHVAVALPACSSCNMGIDPEPGVPQSRGLRWQGCRRHCCFTGKHVWPLAAVVLSAHSCWTRGPQP